jgi:TetR/AcrR family transcriptional regulator, cholesterol catabolism regulator
MEPAVAVAGPSEKDVTAVTAKRRTLPSATLRRAEICKTAARVFRERGFDGTSVGDVARALKMTKAGLYHYFPGKEALLFETLSFGLDQVRDEVTEPARAIPDPETRLREFIVRHARTVLRAQGAVASLVDETRALPPHERRRIEERMRVHFDFLRNTLAELKGQGRLKEVDLTVAAFSVLGMILWLPRWFRHGRRLSEQQVAEEIAHIALGGLLGPSAAASRRARPPKTPAPPPAPR